MKRLRRFKRRFRLGMADYSRFKSTRAAIRNRDLGYEKYMRYLKTVQSDILTLNIRNRDYVKKYNKHHDLIHLTKQETKSRLLPAGIPMPLTYLMISSIDELPAFYDFLAYKHHTSFVIKPNRGHVGKGILVINKRVGKRFITINNRGLELSQLGQHIERINKGRFSRGKPDKALIEECIQPNKMLRNLFSSGLLDIRIICLLGYPVMAMVRLPTNRSSGKANLHRGAIGAGLQLTNGELFHAIHKRREVTHHPDTKYKFIGFKLPDWGRMLHLAVRAQVLSGLGFAGVDLCIDESKGHLIMEVNKRPGLEIQIANKAGLLKRLRHVERFISKNDNSLSTQAKIERSLDWDRNDWTVQ